MCGPPGGFCVWLDVSELGGDEATTVKLYRDAGVRVDPRKLSVRGRKTTASDPGAGYIRLALVSDSDINGRGIAPAGRNSGLIAGPHEHASDRNVLFPGRPSAGLNP